MSGMTTRSKSKSMKPPSETGSYESLLHQGSSKSPSNLELPEPPLNPGPPKPPLNPGTPEPPSNPGPPESPLNLGLSESPSNPGSSESLSNPGSPKPLQTEARKRRQCAAQQIQDAPKPKSPDIQQDDHSGSELEKSPDELTKSDSDEEQQNLVTPPKNRLSEESSSKARWPDSQALDHQLPKHPKQGSDDYPTPSQHNQWIAVFYLVAILVGFVVFWTSTPRKEDFTVVEKLTEDVSTETPHPKDMVRDAYIMASRKLGDAFPSQSTKTWATINAAVKSIMNKDLEPLQPAVILMACLDTATCNMASCLANHIGDMVTEAYGSDRPMTLNISHDLADLPAPEAKLIIDTEMRNHLGSYSRVAVLHNLHHLHGDAAMILHGYCDNDNAPFKEAVLIFTLKLDSDSAIATAAQLDGAIDMALVTAWGRQLDADNLSALYSRIANSPVLVKAESDPKCPIRK